MATMSDHHKTLNEQGEGKCSVLMWDHGTPAGVCDDLAYGKRPPGKTYRDENGEVKRFDGKYEGIISGLACPRHGGPEFRAFSNGVGRWCAVTHDFKNLQVSPAGFGDTREEAIEELATDVKMSKPLRKRARELEKTMQCNCDLDSWEPEDSTGHSWVCRIHKAAMEADK